MPLKKPPSQRTNRRRPVPVPAPAPRPASLSLSDPQTRLRAAVMVIVGAARDPRFGRSLPRDEIRRAVLAAAKRAVSPADPRRPGGSGLAARIDRIFGSVLKAWGPMDERKAETFYSVTESCLDRWLAMPSIRGDVAQARRIIAGIA
jgi:hypothetical protein